MLFGYHPHYKRYHYAIDCRQKGVFTRGCVRQTKGLSDVGGEKQCAGNGAVNQIIFVYLFQFREEANCQNKCADAKAEKEQKHYGNAVEGVFLYKKRSPPQNGDNKHCYFSKNAQVLLVHGIYFTTDFPFSQEFFCEENPVVFFIDLFFLSYGDLVKKIQDILINFFFVYLPQKFVSCAGVKFETDVKALILIGFEKLFAFFTVSADGVHISA